MQLLRKREVKPLLALDFIFGMSADPYFSWKCVQQTILFQLYGKKPA